MKINLVYYIWKKFSLQKYRTHLYYKVPTTDSWVHGDTKEIIFLAKNTLVLKMIMPLSAPKKVITWTQCPNVRGIRCTRSVWSPAFSIPQPVQKMAVTFLNGTLHKKLQMQPYLN